VEVSTTALVSKCGFPAWIRTSRLQSSSTNRATIAGREVRIFAKLGVASRAAMVARFLGKSGTWEQRPEVKKEPSLSLGLGIIS